MILPISLTILSLISVVLFPWIYTLVLVCVTAAFEPLVPLAVGILADTLYYTSHAAAWPLYTLLGLVTSILAYFVRSGLRSSIIR